MASLNEAVPQKKDMPREKLLSKGPEALTDTELLAILMRTGTQTKNVLEMSSDLLSSVGGLRGLCSITPDELMMHPGIKEAKATILSALIELGKRIAALSVARESDWEQRLSRLALDMRFEEREFICAMFLSSREGVIAEERLSYGGLSGAYLDLPVFYRKAVRLCCSSIILVHNHPNGCLRASSDDIELTRRIEEGLELLDIKLKAHYIVADGKITQV